MADKASLERAFLATSHKYLLPFPPTLSLYLFLLFSIASLLPDVLYLSIVSVIISPPLECHHCEGRYFCLFLATAVSPILNPGVVEKLSKIRAKERSLDGMSGKPLVTFTRWFWAKKPD